MNIYELTKDKFDDAFSYIKEKVDSEGKGKDPYQFAINFFSNYPYSQEVLMEEHHILPKFEGGSNARENMIFLSIRAHCFVHWVRWKVYGKMQDQFVYNMRIGDTAMIVKLRRKLALEKNKLNKKGWFDIEAQAEKGRKGGTISGKLNSEAQQVSQKKWD